MHMCGTSPQNIDNSRINQLFISTQKKETSPSMFAILSYYRRKSKGVKKRRGRNLEKLSNNHGR